MTRRAAAPWQVNHGLPCARWRPTGVVRLRGRTPLRRVALLSVCALGFLLVPAAQASFTQVGSFGSAQLGGFPFGVAVDQSSGDVFVADYSHSSVDEFDSQGNYLSSFSAPDASGLAVDQSTGDIYVSESDNNVIDKYDSSGNLILSFGSSGSGSGQLSGPIALAVDQSSGDVYVSDNGNLRVEKFDPSGNYVSEIDGFQNVWTLAVDSAGNVYVVDTAAGEVAKYDASGTFLSVLASGSQFQGAATDSSDDVFILDSTNQQLLEYDSSGIQIDSFGPAPSFSLGMAFGNTAGLLYVADANNNDVAIFGPVVAQAPSVDGESSSDVSPVVATLHAQINPNHADTTCEFEYVDQADYNPSASDPYGAGQTAPCSPADLGSGGSDVAAIAALSNLAPSTTYHWRVVATNSVNTTNGSDQTLTTLPPVSIEFVRATNVGEGNAKLVAQLNPNGADTSYHFEFGTADCATGPCTSLPVPDGDAGSGDSDVPVSAQLTGLASGTTYHYRLVATNSYGTSTSADHTFTTFSAPTTPGGSCTNPQPGYSAYLPDCRAYEQATPVDKNGTNPGGQTGLIEAASGGDAITFLSDAGIPGGTGAQDFPLYLSSRGTDGWSTQGLYPPASVAQFAGVVGWSGDLSEVFDTATNSGSGTSLLLRSSADGSLQTIVPSNTAVNSFSFAGASADGSRVFFEEDGAQLLPGAAAAQDNLYEWDRATGVLSLVGVLPDGTTPPGGSFAGPYDWRNGSVTNIGGAEHGYYTRSAVSTDGSRVFFTAGGSGQLYVRESGTSTVRVSASQKTNGTGPNGTDPNGPQPAAFMSATPNGAHALLTSPEELTNDATTGSADQGNDLYEWANGALTDLTPDTNAGDPNGAEVQGVLGISDNGSYVYFVANGVLAAGASPGTCNGSPSHGLADGGSCNLYQWHDGVTTFIAQLGDAGNGYGVIGLGANINWLPRPIGAITTDKASRVTPDGQTLLFTSGEQLTGYDNAGMFELYRYSPSGGGLTCVSCDPTGAAPTGKATLRSITALASPPSPAAFLPRNLSDSGDRVFFESPDQLLPAATDGVQNVYEWEADGAGSCHSSGDAGGCIYLVSSGKSPDPSYFADASANGDDAFLFTSQPLVGQDQDHLVDIYDARVAGGIASQNPPNLPAPCSGDSCKPPPSQPPGEPGPGSSTFSGAGNAIPNHQKPKHCGRGKVVRHGTCVKKHHHHRRHRRAAHQAANRNRRAGR